MKLIMWGGFWDKARPLTLKTIRSHESVRAYFLTKYLSKYFDITNITKFDDIHMTGEIILSTYQAGFTKLGFRLGRACSIVDDTYKKDYEEDILFTVLPPHHPKARGFGWHAEPELCYPEEGKRILIDHPPYSRGQRFYNRIGMFYDAFRGAENVYSLTENGLCRGVGTKSHYKRHQRIPYLDFIKCLRKTAIFCVTHYETASLAAIEASMCGAILYVPWFIKTFIPQPLLKQVPHRIIYTERDIKKHLSCDLKRNRPISHNRLKETNSWEVGAGKIRECLIR